MLSKLGSRGRVWRVSATVTGAAIVLAAGGCSTPAAAQLVPPPAPAMAPFAGVTFADVAGLVEASAIVALVEVRSQAVVEPARAPGLVPGRARLYIEGATQGVLFGRSALGTQVSFLADVPLLANGKPPKLKKQRWLLFAQPVPNRPGSLQLVAPDGYLVATSASEQLTRAVIAAFAAPAVPAPIRGVRDVMSVAGNLAGESETQLFIDTAGGNPAALSIVRRPGMAPRWGASWSEIVDEAARPPEPNTIAWYRLACFLPSQLPQQSFLQADPGPRAQAEADYRLVLEQLGPCPRTRPPLAPRP